MDTTISHTIDEHSTLTSTTIEPSTSPEAPTTTEPTTTTFSSSSSSSTTSPSTTHPTTSSTSTEPESTSSSSSSSSTTSPSTTRPTTSSTSTEPTPSTSSASDDDDTAGSLSYTPSYNQDGSIEIAIHADEDIIKHGGLSYSADDLSNFVFSSSSSGSFDSDFTITGTELDKSQGASFHVSVTYGGKRLAKRASWDLNVSLEAINDVLGSSSSSSCYNIC
ncbi:unnamed protein product [Ambrosiozyma monospora]|uniref:Unnamed protein product n=1 Tax=Ambrosiozyma monospora TaxID=43982 RepID=A0ACB5UAI6_AMBMO|nr:unnamed protein product [Ambrosiozyma monospora]